ncbi:hypothetical protein BDV18DRAFT_162819 [Aspergillus unguis]
MPEQPPFMIRDLAAAVVRPLDEAQVPYVLFGRMTMGLVGSEGPEEDIEIVVPDESFQAAIDAFTASTFEACTDRACKELNEDRHPEVDQFVEITEEQMNKNREDQVYFGAFRYHPIPPVHFHLEPLPLVLSFFRQSHLLWWLPQIEPGAPAPDDPHFVLSTNATRLPPKGLPEWEGLKGLQVLGLDNVSSGPWSHLYPIKVLTAEAHVEASILLLCRDLHAIHKLDWRWFCQLYSLAERKVPGQRREDAQYKIREEFRPFWDLFRGHVPVEKHTDIFATLLELRKALLARGELPDARASDPADPPRFLLTEDCGASEEYDRAMAIGAEPWIGYKLFALDLN